MSDESEDPPLLYSLCALAGWAAILNAVLLLWQCLKLNNVKGYTFVKYSLLLVDGAYALTGLALVLLVLYKDVGGNSLCQAGGYLVLAGTQLALWLQATSCVALLLWKKESLSPDLQRRNKPIFTLIASAQCLVITLIAAIPYMHLPYFDGEDVFYYTCTPLRLPGEKGWAYSTLVLMLDWIACALAVVTLVKLSFLYSSCRNPETSSADRLEELHLEGRKLRQQRQAFLVHSTCTVGWLGVLAVANITYFSKGNLDQETGQWILGFCLSVTLCLRPSFIVVHYVISKWLNRRGHGVKSYVESLFQCRPSGLHRLARLPDSHQTNGVQKYLIQWRDGKSNQLLSGTMKSFISSTHYKWRNEVNALEKLGPVEHPNFCKYLWVSPNNPFTQSICNNTGDPASRHVGVICSVHNPDGTLMDVLQTKIQLLTDPTIHKISVDVANGLQFLHKHGIVHNGLNTKSIFMTNVSERSGIKALIGDLENSYILRDNESNISSSAQHLYNETTTCSTNQLFSISSKMALQPDSGENHFAADIKAFGLVLLEMLVAVSQYQQRVQSMSRVQVTRLVQDVQEAPVDPVQASTPHDNYTDNKSTVSSSYSVKYRNNNNNNHDQNQGAAAVKKHTNNTLEQVNQPITGEGTISSSVDLCRDCSEHRDVSDDTVECEQHSRIPQYSHHHSNEEQEELCENCQQHSENTDSARVIEVCYGPLKTDRKGHNTPPKLSVRAFGVDKAKVVASANVHNVTVPARAHLPANEAHVVELGGEIGESDTDSMASVYRPYSRRGSHKQILTNGSFITPRTTPELRTPQSQRSENSLSITPTSPFIPISVTDVRNLEQTVVQTEKMKNSTEHIPTESRPNNTNNSSLKETDSRRDTPLLVLPEVGFHTIYEEDEHQNTLPKRIKKPQIPPKPRKVLKPPVPPKRRPPPPLPRTDSSSRAPKDTDSSTKKRFSMASLDESVFSADSGLGSSHYGSYYGSEISSIYLQPGSRDTIYSGSTTDASSEAYLPVVKPLSSAHKYGSNSRITTDSGIDSSAESYDELNARLNPGQVSVMNAQQYSHTLLANNNDTVYMEEDNDTPSTADNTYEILPDIIDNSVSPKRKGKQPCVGHHKHLGGQCEHNQFLSNNTSALHKAHGITISTQTTGSLERQKYPDEKMGKYHAVENQWKSLVGRANFNNSNEESEDSMKGGVTLYDHNANQGEYNYGYTVDEPHSYPASHNLSHSQTNYPQVIHPIKHTGAYPVSAFRKPISSSSSSQDTSYHYNGDKQLHHSDEEKLIQVFDRLRQSGKLNIVAGQMMPLLNEFWKHKSTASTDEILSKLEQVLPTNSV